MTHVQMSDLEVAVNEKIRAGCEMFPTLYESKDDLQLLDVSQQYLLTFSALTHSLLRLTS